MSDPEVPQPEQPADVNDVVDSAKAGLDAAAAAGADVPAAQADATAPTDSDEPGQAPADSADVASDAAAPADVLSTDDAPAAGEAPAVEESAAAAHVDPDLAAFEEAERAFPGTFSAAPPPAVTGTAAEPASADVQGADAETAIFAAPAAHVAEESAMADAAYAATAPATEQIVPSEPLAAQILPQPIFVQAPEPPRDRGNRGTAAGIGLLATVSFAILYLGTALGFGALAGDVTGENIGQAALAPLTTWGFWVPVVVFFLGFWLLGAIINRGRWGLWVVFGIVVGAFAYGGHLLGQLFEAPFWKLTAAQGSELVGEQLLAPLAIAAFVFGRELTIWFGAWVARSGARKTELNAEAQREYERTLEAGPTLSR